MSRSSQSRLSLAMRSEAPASREASVSPTATLPATFTAVLAALDSVGRAWVEWKPEPASPRRASRTNPSQTSPARSTVALATEHVGREVLVCRANRLGDLVIVGVLNDPVAPSPTDDPSIDLVIERRRVVIAARTEVVLRCGEGSITLAADGKVTIRGVDVVSSAVRTQRIRGGAVRIN